MSNVKNLTSVADILQSWTDDIAPNYFDFDNINNYKAGLFGYVNEVMATTAIDVFNAVNIARREFYPVSAQYPSSLYDMAVLQKVDLPQAKPAKCRGLLILDRDEVIKNSTISNGVYTCVIDNTCKIVADNLDFCFLYPIIITSNNIGGKWNHTIHYDKNNINSLDDNTSNEYYISNKTVTKNGKAHLIMAVTLYQTTLDVQSQLISVDPSIGADKLEYNFEGQLAGFDAEYFRNPSVNKSERLVKIINANNYPKKPFMLYRLNNSQTIEASFPKNIYFNPEAGSEIRLSIYTTKGSGGNKDSFVGELACALDSERYPYNNNMTMSGIIDGAITGGKDSPNIKEYAQQIQDAYSTNLTYTNVHDLQVLFDKSTDSRNRLTFKKTRADAFQRSYGTHMILKDYDNNIVPTNTLDIHMISDQIDGFSGSSDKIVIKPGTLFEYDPASDANPDRMYYGRIYKGHKLMDDLNTKELQKKFLYTNPFLIIGSVDPNIVGFFNPSINDIKPISYSYLNDASIVQFIGANLKVERNAIQGENFYRISISITPTTEVDHIKVVKLVADNDPDKFKRAKANGVVLNSVYKNGKIITTIRYDKTNETEEIESGVLVTRESANNYRYSEAYEMKFKTNDRFIEGDIIAEKRCLDLGKIRACVDIKEVLGTNNLYIPMAIEKYDAENNLYVLAAYISTQDKISGKTVLINNGICNKDGTMNDDVSIRFSDVPIEINVFYNYDDANIAHKYSTYEYFGKHTLTNAYEQVSTTKLNLITPVDYIRSPIILTPLDNGNTRYNVIIQEVPLVNANWIKKPANSAYFIKAFIKSYERLRVISRDNLENNFGFDIKLYNTYGKSSVYSVGIKHNYKALDNVSLTFKFGVYLNALTDQGKFVNDFKKYLKDAIERLNTSINKNIYILNLVRDLQNNFNEIAYLEYYGINEYDADAQKLEPADIGSFSREKLQRYVPEFMNVKMRDENGRLVPDIEITILNRSDDQ